MRQYTKKAPATAGAHLSIVMLFKQSHDTKSSIFPPLRQKTSSVPHSARSAKFPPARTSYSIQKQIIHIEAADFCKKLEYFHAQTQQTS